MEWCPCRTLPSLAIKKGCFCFYPLSPVKYIEVHFKTVNCCAVAAMIENVHKNNSTVQVIITDLNNKTHDYLANFSSNLSCNLGNVIRNVELTPFLNFLKS